MILIPVPFISTQDNLERDWRKPEFLQGSGPPKEEIIKMEESFAHRVQNLGKCGLSQDELYEIVLYIEQDMKCYTDKADAEGVLYLQKEKTAHSTTDKMKRVLSEEYTKSQDSGDPQEIVKTIVLSMLKAGCNSIDSECIDIEAAKVRFAEVKEAVSHKEDIHNKEKK